MYSGFNYICLTCPSISNYHLSYLIFRTPHNSRSESHTQCPPENLNHYWTETEVGKSAAQLSNHSSSASSSSGILDWDGRVPWTKEIKSCSQRKIDHLGQLADHPTTLIHLCHHLGNFRLGLCVRQRDRWPVPCSCWPALRWVWRASLVEPPSFSPPTSFVPETPFGTW